MKISAMFPSKYLGKEDVVRPLTVKIEQVTREEISDGNNGKEEKNVVWFANDMKPMILNRGNAECLGEMFGDDSDAWIGKSVELYIDPSVMFAGKRVGGLRVRPATGRATGTAPTHAPPQHGGAAQQPVQTGGERWDMSDGQNLMLSQTSAQILDFLTRNNIDPSKIRVKPAGAPREQAKTAAEYGFIPQQAPAPDNSPIPF